MVTLRIQKHILNEMLHQFELNDKINLHFGKLNENFENIQWKRGYIWGKWEKASLLQSIEIGAKAADFVQHFAPEESLC